MPRLYTGAMDRRQFLKNSGAALALSGLGDYAQGAIDEKRRRVGLIGCGWYGKIDLLRLIQVSPVEVVSLCDVDRNMLAQAADIVASRQQSKKKPRTYSDFRKMLAERDLDIVLIAPPDHWHALIMIEATRSGPDIWVQKPISADVLEGKAMSRRRGSTAEWCRWDCSGAVRRIWWRPRSDISTQASWERSAWSKFIATTTCAQPENPPDTAPPEYWITKCGRAPHPCGLTTG